MSTLLGLVRRVGNPDKTVAFYKLLGLNLTRHKHGGPVHFEVRPVHQDFVVEVYQESPRYITDVLMVGVEDLPATILLLDQNGGFFFGLFKKQI